MNCEKAQLWMQALADGELGGWRSRRLERHLALCERCAQELAALHRLRTTLASVRGDWAAQAAAEVGGREFFWLQVRRRLPGNESQRIVRAPRLGRPAYLAATAVATLVALFTLTVWEGRRIESLEFGLTEVTDVKTPFSNTHQLTYISAESGTTFIWIYGLPTEFEEEEAEI